MTSFQYEEGGGGLHLMEYMHQQSNLPLHHLKGQQTFWLRTGREIDLLDIENEAYRLLSPCE